MRKLMIALIFMALVLKAEACDICGSGVSNYNPLLFPQLSKNYIGFSWVHRPYHSYGEDGSKGHEYYNAILLSAQYSPVKKLHLSVIVPWQLNKMRNLDGQKTISGIGDVNFLVAYRVLDKKNTALRQSIIAGGGIKLPTGKYRPLKGVGVEEQNFQAGTGSTDYLLTASYHFGFRQWTISAATSYKYNTQNADHYRFGDVFVNGITAVYQKQIKNFSVSPYVQFINEIQMKDADDHVLQNYSGGHVFYAGSGADINFRTFSGGINYQFIPGQRLAEGTLFVRPRFSSHLFIKL